MNSNSINILLVKYRLSLVISTELARLPKWKWLHINSIVAKCIQDALSYIIWLKKHSQMIID